MLQCPIPIAQYPQIQMAHGGGGRLMNQLIQGMFAPFFTQATQHDSSILTFGEVRLAFTTDSYVVNPLFFPGGDIGKLAVYGTVNDLAMSGARPMYLSLSFIIEEGLPMETLWQVVQSIKVAAELANVQIVTGDTKVVDHGKGDGLFINTAGIGVVKHNTTIAPKCILPGDQILINGGLAQHGIAIMAQREGLTFESEIESDTAPLAALVMDMLQGGVEVHCMRDLTRGGLASALVEIATAAQQHLHIDENCILVREDVRGACEMLGLDPLYIANEGRFAVFVKAEHAEKALSIMRQHPLGREAQIIGAVTHETPGQVTLKSAIGAVRVVDMLSGEQLPRIC